MASSTVRFTGRWLSGLMLLMGVALLGPLARWLTNEWLTNDYYSHGFLIPVVSGYLAWRKRSRLHPQTDYRGMVLAALAAGGYLYAFYARAFHWAAVAAIFLLAGIVWAQWGWSGLKELAFPLAFLAFMVPLPWVEASSVPLSLLTGRLATGIMQGMGMDVSVQGAAVSLPRVNLVVGAQCSGVRSLISLFALAAIWSYVVEGPWLRRLLLWVAVIPLAILGNIFRVSSLLWVANRWGAAAGFTYYHTYSGFVFFALALSLLLFLARGLGCHRIRKDL